MKWMMTAGALVLGLSGCANVVETAKAPAIGESPRAAAKSVFLDVGVERASGERIAGTNTQLDLMRPLKFSAVAANGSHVDVEIFAEPALESADGYRVSLEVRESDKDGRTMSWRPALSLASGKEAVASIDWAGDGRRLRIRISEDAPLPAIAATEHATDQGAEVTPAITAPAEVSDAAPPLPEADAATDAPPP